MLLEDVQILWWWAWKSTQTQWAILWKIDKWPIAHGSVLSSGFYSIPWSWSHLDPFPSIPQKATLMFSESCPSGFVYWLCFTAKPSVSSKNGVLERFYIFQDWRGWCWQWTSTNLCCLKTQSIFVLLCKLSGHHFSSVCSGNQWILTEMKEVVQIGPSISHKKGFIM